MNKNTTEFLKLNLHLFGEGSGDGGGTGAEGANGVTAGASLPANGVSNSQNTADSGAIVTDGTEDRNAKFEALIKGEYKDLYDARVSDTVQKRLKNTKETVDKYNALSPMLEMLGRKYGVDPTDSVALNKAIEEDNTYYEEEALEKGMSVEQLKAFKKMERENADLKAQFEAQKQKENTDRAVAELMKQGDELKKVYPGFDLANELNNPQFFSLINNNIDVRTAYEVIHKDEIIPAAMQFAVSSTKQKIANNIMAGGSSRPEENGLSSASSVISTSDVSQLTKAQREELIKRAAAGERITFGRR